MVTITQDFCPKETVIKKDDEATLEVLERSFMRAMSRRFFAKNVQGKQRY